MLFSDVDFSERCFQISTFGENCELRMSKNTYIYILVTNYNFLFIIMTILVTNNFLFYKLISKLVTIVSNNF